MQELQNEYQNFKFFTIEYQGAIGVYFFTYDRFISLKETEKRHFNEIRLRRGVKVTVNRMLNARYREHQTARLQASLPSIGSDVALNGSTSLGNTGTFDVGL